LIESAIIVLIKGHAVGHDSLEVLVTAIPPVLLFDDTATKE
jgi:hypothetical protein